MLKFEITLEFYRLGVMMYGYIDLKWCSCGVADMQLADRIWTERFPSTPSFPRSLRYHFTIYERKFCRARFVAVRINEL